MNTEDRTQVVYELRKSLERIALSETHKNFWNSWEEVYEQLEEDAKAKDSLYIFKETAELHVNFDRHLNQAIRILDQIRELRRRGRA